MDITGKSLIHDNLMTMSEALHESARAHLGYEWLIALLLSHLTECGNYSRARLLETACLELSALLEQDSQDPAAEAYLRLRAMLKGQMGEPIHEDGLPRALRSGFPRPPHLALIKDRGGDTG